MDFVKTYSFVSFLIAILFFIFKTLIFKFSEKTEENETLKKQILKDSFYVFIICYLVFVFKDKLFYVPSAKTHVFTNEPNF